MPTAVFRLEKKKRVGAIYIAVRAEGSEVFLSVAMS